MAAPAVPAWDFEPRSVALSLSVRATFHPSVGSATVSLPWLDAAGNFSAVASTGPLSSCCVEATDPNCSREVGCHPGSVCAYWEQAATPLSVTFELVRRLQHKVLPVSMSLARPDGSATEVSSAARVHLGPLLLKGSNGSKDSRHPSKESQGEPEAPRLPCEVFATWTETIGIAGLYRLEVRVWSEEPLLSQAMRERLVPACFQVEAVRSLPNEASLSETCEDVYVEVYPQLGSTTSRWLAEECKKVKSKGRPHDTVVRFSEPVVWLLGLAPHHVVREWLHHEGLIVEVHDRDRKPPEPPEGTKEAEVEEPPEDKKAGKGKDKDKDKGKGKVKGKGKEAEVEEEVRSQEAEANSKPPEVHPHGVARIPLAALLGNGCLKVPLRADVFPMRGDKKRRRAEALSQEVHAKGILEPEARDRVEAGGMDKREDTPDYHACGTVCAITATLGARLAKAEDLQAADQAKIAQHWAANEQRVDPQGNVWVANLPEGATHGVESGWCPRASPYRAKLPLPGGEEVAGPWRARREDAEADEKRLRAAMGDGAEADAEAARAEVARLQEEAEAAPEATLDCRYERYGRVVCVVSENETTTIKAVLQTVRTHNAKVLGVSASSVQLDTHQLTAEQKTDPHFDLITGFSLLDGRARLMVVEGLRGRGLQALLDAVPRNRPNCSEFKLLHNPDVGFNERLYGDFGATVQQIKIRFPLEQLASRTELYSMSGLEDEEMLAGLEAPKLLVGLKQAMRLRSLRENSSFPKTVHLTQLNVLFGSYISDEEMKGDAASPRTRPSVAKHQPEDTVIQETIAPTRRSIVATKRNSVDIRFLEEAAGASDSGGESPDHVRVKVTRKPMLENTNPTFTQSLDIRRSTSTPDLPRKNREAVYMRSQENAKLNDLLGKKRVRETPFLDGKQVHIYSGQKLNSAEMQKEWMRQHMDHQQDKQMWTYNPAYNSGNFEFSGAEQPGLKPHQAIKPNDTYARKEGDTRSPWRHDPARPKEAFRKPPRDVDPARRDMIREAYVENEGRTLKVGEERSQPVAAEVYFEPDKIPHRRRITHRPFDATRSGPRAADFGPKTSTESVHYHGRPPGEDLNKERAEHSRKEQELAASKIIGSKTMRYFSQISTRQGISDMDRYESMSRDRDPQQSTFPSTIRTSEGFHDNGEGRPDQEWHARLRENDSSPPYEVQTGTYIKRDSQVGSKRACMSGKLSKAPWRHDASGAPKGTREYPSAHDFNLTRPPPKSRLCENQAWKNASRTNISQGERSTSLPYLRPAHYGVSLLT